MFSAIFKAVRAVIKKVTDLIKKIVKDFWPIILIVAAVYFAPAIGSWLSSVGAPAWMTSAMSGLSHFTPALTSAVGWVTSGVGSLWASGSEAFGALSLYQKAALVAGVGFALVPEEMAKVVSELGTVAGDIGSSVGSGMWSAITGFASSPIGLVALGLGGFLIIKSLTSRG